MVTQTRNKVTFIRTLPVLFNTPTRYCVVDSLDNAGYRAVLIFSL